MQATVDRPGDYSAKQATLQLSHYNYRRLTRDITESIRRQVADTKTITLLKAVTLIINGYL